jgi:glyoxylase-like metal-dependent hydrolase (beta-lactamase superfamily II)
MKIHSHGRHLIQLSRFGFVNCYLIREDDGFTLVDTTFAGAAKPLLDIARTFHVPILRILLTHAHGDHVGSLDALHTLLPEAEVAISDRDAAFLRGDTRLAAHEPEGRLFGYASCKTLPTRLLQEGDHVGSLEVIATPGHTPGHIALLDTRDRTLIAGDAFQTLGGVAVTGTLRSGFPLSAMVTWHKPTALKSARKVRALASTRLAVGHGAVLEQPLAAMDTAIQALEAELARKGQSNVTTSGA